MSVRIMSLVFDAKLAPASKAVLLALADHANEDGLSVYPSVGLLAIKTGYNERTVQKALSELRSAKLIYVVRQASRYRPTEYGIDIKKLKALRHPGLARGESGAPLNPRCRADKPADDPRGESPAPLDDPRGESNAPLVGPRGESGAPGVNLSAPRGESDSPEPSINHQSNTEGLKKKKREEAPPLPLPQTPLEASRHPDINLFQEVCGRIPGQGNYSVVIDTVRFLRTRLEPTTEAEPLAESLVDQALVDYLKPFWLAWSSRKTQDGKPYSPSGIAWLTEWALNGHIPKQPGNGRRAAASFDDGSAQKAMINAYFDNLGDDQDGKT